ncbi:iron-containing alcohol dehydrogenase [Glaciecola sp. XM2]|uniref:iron-containing alcohol dehydrogenase n=1 Tax=Glaciecola sp. XM2 TaxID=1914931 RepID=UPI001BDDE6A0|nr:iron-containing alcohol dehydrogenase [Glaciecola sp. XM2]MBT1451841.1 iron-containing alcohol dehydrogenase [Glaciecola sp. XM2]
MHAFEFHAPKSIICEANGILKLPSLCAKLGIHRPLVVTDAGLVKHGLLDELTKSFRQANSTIALSIFDEVESDPSEATVLKGIDLCKSQACDGVIGFGGGSPMDVAKVIASASSQTVLPSMYGIDNVTERSLPLVLIPTTSGTGSEVTPIAILTTGKTTKAGIVSAQLIPDVAILDAHLTLNLPSHVTAATGIDAMVHAIEAYTGKHKKNIYSDMLATKALSLLSSNIKTATFDGHNLAARQNMLLGACFAGQAFANSPVAAVHALAYPLGGHFHIPHGLSNALVLPYVMRHNLSACHQLYAELAVHIMPHNIDKQDSMDLARSLIEYIEMLIIDLKLPTQLRALNITLEDLPKLASEAMLQTRLLINNPREVTQDDALRIYQQAF